MVGTLVALALALAWAPLWLLPGSGLTAPAVQSVLYVGLFILTVRSRWWKARLVRAVQRWTINPLMRLFIGVGVNPLGLAILETTGRISGAPRQTPVGNGQAGGDFWIIAEHGTQSNYVRNILRNPTVRVRLRQGLRYRWVAGTATVLPEDDALARQRRIIAWHPLRAFNAMNVRVLGTDLLTVHVALHVPEDETRPPRPHISRGSEGLADDVAGRGARAGLVRR